MLKFLIFVSLGIFAGFAEAIGGAAFHEPDWGWRSRTPGAPVPGHRSPKRSKSPRRQDALSKYNFDEEEATTYKITDPVKRSASKADPVKRSASKAEAFAAMRPVKPRTNEPAGPMPSAFTDAYGSFESIPPPPPLAPPCARPVTLKDLKVACNIYDVREPERGPIRSKHGNNRHQPYPSTLKPWYELDDDDASIREATPTQCIQPPRRRKNKWYKRPFALLRGRGKSSSPQSSSPQDDDKENTEQGPIRSKRQRTWYEPYEDDALIPETTHDDKEYTELGPIRSKRQRNRRQPYTKERTGARHGNKVGQRLLPVSAC